MVAVFQGTQQKDQSFKEGDWAKERSKQMGVKMKETGRGEKNKRGNQEN